MASMYTNLSVFIELTTQPSTKGFKQTPKAALMCLLFKNLWLLWICSGSLGYRSCRYCTFEPVKVLFLPKKKNSKKIFILHTCESRYDNNMNKAGKSPHPVQTNKNINNPPPF